MGEILDADWSRENLLRSDWSGPSVATITTVKFLHLLLLLDIVQQVRKVSLVFQREEGTIALVQDKINALNISVEALKTRPRRTPAIT